MASSLDSLVKNLVKSAHEFFSFEDSSEKYDLLTKKGICPYEYMTSWEKFSETQFPPIKDFYSKLNDSKVSEDDYQHAQKFGGHSALKIWGNIAIFTSKSVSFYSQTCSRHSGALA